MRKWFLGFVVVMSGCGVDADALDEGEKATQRQALGLKRLLPAPYVPATPRLYTSGMLLYPRTISSAYTITYGSDTNPKEFYAWGFDVVNRECLFHVRGNVLQYANFTNDINTAVNNVPQNNPTYHGSGSQGQIGLPKGPGPSGGDRWAEAFYNSNFNP